MTDGPPPRHLHPVTGHEDPPFDPDYDRPADRRVPPQDTAAEQAVLGAMLIDPTVINDVTAVIDASDHYSTAHETIHNAILDLHHRGHPADPVTLAQHLAKHRDSKGRTNLERIGGAPYLHTLMAAVPVTANAARYAEIVRDHARLRAVTDTGARLTQLGYSADITKVDAYLGEAVQALDDAAMRFGQRTELTTTGLHDLSWVLTGQAPEIPPPVWCRRADGTALFYEGKVNGLFGDPEHGKTWVAQAAAVEALHAGRQVAMIDVDHNGANHTAARLLLLGATLDQLANPDLFRYYEPEDGDQLLAAATEITRLSPAIYILDSLGEVFPLFGVNSNDGDEVTGIMRKICLAQADTGTCVITIDHLPKGTEVRASGFAIGTTAKKRMMRGSYIRVDAPVKPVPGKVGRLTLRIEKDTSGELRKACGGGYAGTFTLDSTQPHITTWAINTESPITADGRFRPTHLMEQISRYIEDNDQCSGRDIREAINSKTEHVTAAIKALIEEGFVSVMKGSRNAMLHHSVAHYREAEDDNS